MKGLHCRALKVAMQALHHAALRQLLVGCNRRHQPGRLAPGAPALIAALASAGRRSSGQRCRSSANGYGASVGRLL